MTEFLNQEEGILVHTYSYECFAKVSRESESGSIGSVRQILLGKGSYIKKRRYPKHRRWREPSFREGQMVQFDTSDYDWLEGRGPKLYLIGGVDDATSKVAGAKFVLTDGVKQNMGVFRDIVRKRGIPSRLSKIGGQVSVYVDRGSNFSAIGGSVYDRKTTRHQSMEYQLIPPMAGPLSLPGL